jgi:hypothetical protein
MLLCDTYPQLGYRLMRNLAADLAMKIRNTDLRVREQLYWSHGQRAALPAAPDAADPTASAASTATAD